MLSSNLLPGSFKTTQVVRVVKNLPANAGDLGWEDTLEEQDDNPFQSSCLKIFMGKRSLVGYSPWGCKELDMTQHHTQYYIVHTFHSLYQVVSLGRWGKEQGLQSTQKTEWRDSLLYIGCQELEARRYWGCKCGWAVNEPEGMGGVSQLLQLAEWISEATVESELKHTQGRRNHFQRDWLTVETRASPTCAGNTLQTGQKDSCVDTQAGTVFHGSQLVSRWTPLSDPTSPS